MPSCTNCNKYFKQADNSVVGVFDENGAMHYIMPDRSITTTQPATFVSTNRVTKAEYDAQHEGAGTVVVLEEYDANMTPTGVLVRIVEDASGVITRENLSTGAAYTSPAGFTLHKNADYEFQERTEELCDNGVNVLRTTVYRNGNLNDIASQTVTTVGGAAHTLSGAEVLGNCQSLSEFDHQSRKFISKTDPLSPRVDGYIRYTTDKTTGATTSSYFDADDNPLAKSDYEVADCQ